MDKKENKLINNINPQDLKYYKYLTNDSFVHSDHPFSFLSFKSKVSCIYYLIYSKEDCSIVFYDLNNDQKINEIKREKDDSIGYIKFRYYYDKNKHRELM